MGPILSKIKLDVDVDGKFLQDFPVVHCLGCFFLMTPQNGSVDMNNWIVDILKQLPFSSMTLLGCVAQVLIGSMD